MEDCDPMCPMGIYVLAREESLVKKVLITCCDIKSVRESTPSTNNPYSMNDQLMVAYIQGWLGHLYLYMPFQVSIHAL